MIRDWKALKLMLLLLLLLLFSSLIVWLLNEFWTSDMEFDTLSDILPTIGNGDDNGSQWCQRMASGHLGKAERSRLQRWSFDEKPFLKALMLEGKKGGNKEKSGEDNDKCTRLRRIFPFRDQPSSEEEKQFPLAYGVLVYKSPVQVLTMMSAIYQPQNAYCMVVDEKADDEFKEAMHFLSDCFPNIFVMGSVGQVGWCKFGVTRAVFNCFRYLTELNHAWRYYQYLSGVDLPLKTNLEMVRIFKALNGTINVKLERYNPERLLEETQMPPLPLWKSSLSALISRQSADAMVKSDKMGQLMRFLQHTHCSDEAVWATMAGNPQDVSIPGGFDAKSFHKSILGTSSNKCEKQVQQARISMNQTTEKPAFFPPTSYYISRYQVWVDLIEEKCKGKFVKDSCVFGVDDLPELVRRPELVAHKLYLDYQPAAYFCLWKLVQERAHDLAQQQKFKADAYSELPIVRATRNGGLFPYNDSCDLL